MARTFTTAQLALLHSANVKMRLLATFYLDAGTFRFVDDWQQMSDGTNNYVGASALASATDIKSSSPFAAESVTITVDGTRLSQVGISDPAYMFQVILTYLLSNRRVDLAFGLCYPEDTQFSIVIPVYSGKISNAKATDQQVPVADFTSGSAASSVASKLTIQLDSLATRYQYNSNRLRSQKDQLEIDATDNFFAFVGDTVASTGNLFWGRATPRGSQTVFNNVATYRSPLQGIGVGLPGGFGL